MAKSDAKLPATAEPEIVGQIVRVPIADIDVRDRLRPVDAVWASALGKIMAAEGQRTAIEVCRLPGKRAFLLVAGAHRLEGGRLEGWPAIDAIVVGNDAIERRLREVTENLWRKDLSALDRPAFVAELVRLKKIAGGIDPEADGRSTSVNVRWSKRLKDEARDTTEIISVVYGWAAEVAKQLDLSERTIRLDLEIYRGLLPEIADQVRSTPIAKNMAQLRTLAKLAPADQRAAMTMIVDGAAKTPGEAAAMLSQKAVPTADEKAWSAFFGGWNRMSAARRKDALRELAEQGLPKGVSITFDGGDAK